MTRIRIISTPPGPAPEDIRSKWVGCEMESTGREGDQGEDPLIFHVGEENIGGYVVTVKAAMHALQDHDIEAHGFWLPLTRFNIMKTLTFNADCVEELPSE